MQDTWRDRPRAPKAGAVLCRVTDIEDGRARVFEFGTGWGAFELVVVRNANELHAYINECTHQPLPLNIGRQARTSGNLLFCDHHAAAFRFSDGHCVAGVCTGTALISVPLCIEDGIVSIG